MLSTDGTYHDVRVTLTKMVRDQKAINFVESLDDRNRGFDTSSDLELMAVEFKLENLENTDLVLMSDFTLADSNANLVSRTGSMFNIANKSNVKAHQTVTMQDWFYTSSLDKQYLIWGKSFERKYPEIWFRVLKDSTPSDNN